jgi:hypothetical protein
MRGYPGKAPMGHGPPPPAHPHHHPSHSSDEDEEGHEMLERHAPIE